MVAISSAGRGNKRPLCELGIERLICVGELPQVRCYRFRENGNNSASSCMDAGRKFSVGSPPFLPDLPPFWRAWLFSNENFTTI
jgi:hypothetical protein